MRLQMLGSSRPQAAKQEHLGLRIWAVVGVFLAIPLILLGLFTTWSFPAAIVVVFAIGSPFAWLHGWLSKQSVDVRKNWRGHVRLLCLFALIALAPPGWSDSVRVWAVGGLAGVMAFFETACLTESPGDPNGA